MTLSFNHSQNPVMKRFFLLVFMSSLAAFNGMAYEGCTNSMACNYDPAATINDPGSCFFGSVLIPVLEGAAGTVVIYCHDALNDVPSLPSGYGFSDFSCVWTTIANDPFCYETLWDGLCTTAYNACCSDQTIYVPAGASNTPPTFACASIPENFYPANQACVLSVIEDQPACMLVVWDELCVEAYHECAHGCSNAVFMIPQPGQSGLPGVVACQNPGFAQYMYANQQCAHEVAYNNPSCVNSVWNQQCQDAYLACCSGGTWYIPDPLTSTAFIGPATNRCDFFGAGIPVAPFCIESLPFAQAHCISVIWDASCNDWYNTCTYGCADPSVFLPAYLAPPGPAVLGCYGPPQGYEPANQSCALGVLFFNPWCAQSAWTSGCHAEYLQCARGCTYLDACNYNAVADIDDGTCVFSSCTDPEAVNHDPMAMCSGGPCIYEASAQCPGDLNGDTVINISDLTLFLALFGQSCTTP